MTTNYTITRNNLSLHPPRAARSTLITTCVILPLSLSHSNCARAVPLLFSLSIKFPSGCHSLASPADERLSDALQSLCIIQSNRISSLLLSPLHCYTRIRCTHTCYIDMYTHTHTHTCARAIYFASVAISSRPKFLVKSEFTFREFRWAK